MSAETVRNQASQQYFELRNELNRANKTKNQKTELEFVIRENDDEHFIVIKSTGAKHGLRLSFRYKKEPFWTPFENETYEVFYKYMFLKISILTSNDDLNINLTLTNWLIRLWMG